VLSREPRRDDQQWHRKRGDRTETRGSAAVLSTDGGVYMYEAAAGSVAFGSYVLARRPARVYFSASGRNPVHQPDGLFKATVGNALFAHSVVTLDFHSMKVYVQPG
jgi:hypothetical protein